jgi:ribosome maturation factor RimP
MGLLFFVHGFGNGQVVQIVAPLREQLIALAEPLLAQLGYELVELDYAAGRAHSVLRVFIDKPEGVGLDDCELVSQELGARLDIEDPLPTAYTLEVSSPGLDRVLRTPAHFQRFIGARIWVELRYTGRLAALGPEGIELTVDGATVSVSFADLARARLAPE